MRHPFEIKYTQDPNIIPELGCARVEAWLQAGAQFGQGFLPQHNSWIDDLDFLPETHHWVALIEGRVVGAARLSRHESIENIPNKPHFRHFEDQLSFPTWAISRLFVQKDFRGLGIGRALDEARLKFAASFKENMGVLAYACGEHRQRSLSRYGFSTLEVKDVDNDIIIAKKFYVMVLDANDNIFASPQTHCIQTLSAAPF